MGLLSSDEEIEKLLEWAPERAGAHFHPRTTGEDTYLAADFYGWMILLDGQFDGAAGRDTVLAKSLVGKLLSVLDDPSLAGKTGVLHGERALADLWQRLCAGMSQAWQERAAGDLHDFIAAYHTEAVHRAAVHCPSVPEYLRLRFDSGGTGIILSISERLHGFEIPTNAWCSPVVQHLREITIHVTDVVQDVVSLAKEEHDGESNNIVIVMRLHDPALTHQAAIGKAQSMVRRWTREFLTLEAQVPSVCDALLLPDEARAAVYQYVDAMRSCMRGNYDWCRTTPRYDPDRLQGTAAVGLLGSMLCATATATGDGARDTDRLMPQG
ncbi:terpene synthase family protein [Streptomyces sp. NRRL B-1347]|uniref:terpene synthase family protein n=1 Tax=Streptomyces sp. NRRL B-1347 TaxID=1476877 RepID=UPI0004C5E9FE|nr:hypothetical protein [Streptomyces sp. NRRL B-1347]